MFTKDALTVFEGQERHKALKKRQVIDTENVKQSSSEASKEEEKN